MVSGTWLIRQWQASPGWAALANDTKQSYSMSFKAIEAWCGKYPPRAVTRKAIKAWQRSLIENRSQAIANIVLTRLHRIPLTIDTQLPVGVLSS